MLIQCLDFKKWRKISTDTNLSIYMLKLSRVKLKRYNYLVSYRSILSITVIEIHYKFWQ